MSSPEEDSRRIALCEEFHLIIEKNCSFFIPRLMFSTPQQLRPSVRCNKEMHTIEPRYLSVMSYKACVGLFQLTVDFDFMFMNGYQSHTKLTLLIIFLKNRTYTV